MSETVKIDQKDLKNLFYYDLETGGFTRLSGGKGSKNRKGSLAGYKTCSGYITITIEGVEYYAHRLAILYVKGTFPVEQVDHIDNNRSNNSYNNLREVTNKENSHNSLISSVNTSGVKGISYINRRNPYYQAAITCNGKTYTKNFSISTYKEKALEEATIYIQKLRTQLHGEYTNHGY